MPYPPTLMHALPTPPCDHYYCLLFCLYGVHYIDNYALILTRCGGQSPVFLNTNFKSIRESQTLELSVCMWNSKCHINIAGNIYRFNNSIVELYDLTVSTNQVLREIPLRFLLYLRRQVFIHRVSILSSHVGF